LTEAAKLAGKGKSWAYRLAALGELPGAVRLGGRWYVKTQAFELWLETLDGEGTEAAA
jgi:excisionase family DNA binding protein